MSTASSRTRRAVAIGGGTGLPVVLRGLVELGFDTTAVVTVADDGGSSGLLREQMGMLPPGDIRNCLVALANAETLPARLFQYRFPHGDGLAGHALGNLVIAALTDLTGSFPAAIEAAGELLGVQGRVLPCTLADVHLHAKDADGLPITGQARLANADGPLADVELEPPCPPAYAPAIEAIRAADVIVIGPGSLFTSVLPNFLVEGVVDAVRESSARRIYVCNLANQRGETGGMNAYDHVRVLLDHGLSGAIDAVLVDASRPVADALDSPVTVERVGAGPDVVARITAAGVLVFAHELSDPAQPLRHDPERLRGALGEVLA
ncbi:MAG: gluconeogenesis factor YvcK family protein [Coriobacteriia bacterium]|nr:gluconeogenesis factor YvcK family protein [Coriobacteriia bacterium]